jgi:hypothetical protein
MTSNAELIFDTKCQRFREVVSAGAKVWRDDFNGNILCDPCGPGAKAKTQSGRRSKRRGRGG